MKTSVSAEVFEKTTRCDKNLICQSPDWVPCRPVTRVIGKAILVLEEGEYEKKSCPYRVAYGTRDYCICPARVKIYDRYRI